jgi:hypothetical protein
MVPGLNKLTGSPEDIRQELKALVARERANLIAAERGAGHDVSGWEPHGPASQPSPRTFGANMRGGVPSNYPSEVPARGEALQFEEPPMEEVPGVRGGTSRAVKEPGGAPAPTPGKGPPPAGTKARGPDGVLRERGKDGVWRPI